MAAIHISPNIGSQFHLPLTLAHTAALLPRPIGVPEELLGFVLYGDVKRVPDIWVVKIPHRQHLGKYRQKQTLHTDWKRFTEY